MIATEIFLTGIRLSRWRGYSRRGVEIVISIDAERSFSISGIRRQTVAVEQRIPVAPVVTHDRHAPLARTLAHGSTRGTARRVIHRDVGTRRHVDAKEQREEMDTMAFLRILWE